MNKNFYCYLLLLTMFTIVISSSCLTNSKERLLIDCWLKENNLNTYGDPFDTVYAGGTPLFNELTGTYLDPYEYLDQRYPEKPWDTSSSRLASQALKEAQQQAKITIKNYINSSSIKEIAMIITYLNYYTSWYGGAAAPAQADNQIYTKLSKESKQLVRHIKQVAHEHFTLQDKTMPMVRSLTCFGDTYFLYIKELLNTRLVNKLFLHLSRSMREKVQRLTLVDLQNIARYLTFYRSWYQSVAPAPVSLQQSLTPETKALLQEIKEPADRYFAQKTGPGIPGASRLSIYGTKYYDKINSWLANQSERRTSKRAPF